jgi:hypothetical protein
MLEVGEGLFILNMIPRNLRGFQQGCRRSSDLLRFFRKNRNERAQRVSLPHAEYSTAERPFAQSNIKHPSAKNEFFAEY